VLDNCAHIEQVSVVPSQARRGVGAALIEHLATIARGRSPERPHVPGLPPHRPSPCSVLARVPTAVACSAGVTPFRGSDSLGGRACA
jgi:GNAT superfamily N-acetyltransferase